MSYDELTAIARETGVLDDPDAAEEPTTLSEMFWATVTCFSAIGCLIIAGAAPQGGLL